MRSAGAVRTADGWETLTCFNLARKANEEKGNCIRGVKELAENATFQRVEGMLYSYYENERKMEWLQSQAEGLEERRLKMCSLKSELRESFAYQGGTGQYTSERVQGKKSIYHSPIESAYEAMEDINSEIWQLWTRQLKLEARISLLRHMTGGIRYALGQLSPFEKEIVEYKYRYRMSTRQIGRVKGMGKNTVERQRQKIVEDLGRVLTIERNE